MATISAGTASWRVLAPCSTLFSPVKTLSSHARKYQQACHRWSTTTATPLVSSPASVKAESQITTSITSTTSTPKALPPLSALPLPVLLRSLFVSAVSSHRQLLVPSLSILTFLTKPNRGFLLSVDRNPVLRWSLKQVFYKQFCAGENESECRRTLDYMRSMGFEGTILTWAKETVFDHATGAAYAVGKSTVATSVSSETCPHIEAWRIGTLHTVAMLSPGDQLAIKLTGAGALANEAFAQGKLAPPQLMAALDDICIASRHRKARILVDAESQHVQKGIARTAVDLMRKYNTEGHALIYNTYQAYLKGTPARLAKNMEIASDEGWTLGVKLVRGAYIASDARNLIHDTKEDTDNAYNTIAQGILRQDLFGRGGTSGKPFPSLNVILASHNMATQMAAFGIHKERTEKGLPIVPVRFAQLHGMSDVVSFTLLRETDSLGASPLVLKCSTWGSMGECLAYLLRRAIENRDAVSRTLDEYTALKAEVRRRVW
ncbi:proline oxidase [Ophiostoma piceae UAMH 11346]|uniref:Proline dehydrogenase n=1 Tax=Ophiostoma piceae (strain UAMH 11346) TaxID=1262450 RepID=S3BSZ9_OPHP1|nr:proline oxidase [Ophiostoma piceae UAMH 11346]